MICNRHLICTYKGCIHKEPHTKRTGCQQDRCDMEKHHEYVNGICVHMDELINKFIEEDDFKV